MKYKILLYCLLLFFVTCKAKQANTSQLPDTTKDSSVQGKDCIDKSKIDPQKNCLKIYRPVCGCDGKKYGNKCEAERAGVTSWTEGECK